MCVHAASLLCLQPWEREECVVHSRDERHTVGWRCVCSQRKGRRELVLGLPWTFLSPSSLKPSLHSFSVVLLPTQNSLWFHEFHLALL